MMCVFEREACGLGLLAHHGCTRWVRTHPAGMLAANAMPDDVAHEEYFIPRVEPWVRDAIAGLGRHSPLPTEGAIAVPCCGAGREVELLAEALPEREIVGVDASPEMCSRARRRCRRFARVRIEHADETKLAAHWGGQTGALLSCFGLETTRDPVGTITDWTRCLAPGGRLVVMLWPTDMEGPEGPFATLRALLAAELGPRDTAWETDLGDAIEAAGARVLEDGRITHSMEHPHAHAFFDAFAYSKIGRAVALEHGIEVIDRLRTGFSERMPERPLRHAPAARRIVAHRPV
jgi:ubiquinone/menaquinone biosynthesis C-methylase UbiE